MLQLFYFLDRVITPEIRSEMNLMVCLMGLNLHRSKRDADEEKCSKLSNECCMLLLWRDCEAHSACSGVEALAFIFTLVVSAETLALPPLSQLLVTRGDAIIRLPCRSSTNTDQEASCRFYLPPGKWLYRKRKRVHLRSCLLVYWWLIHIRIV